MTKKRIIFVSYIVLVAVTMFVANVSGSSQATPTSPDYDGAERQKIERDAINTVTFNWNPQTGKPSFIRGHIPLSVVGVTKSTSPATAAYAFVDRYADLLGIINSAQELTIGHVETDELGMNHVTLKQLYQGVEVYGADIRIHLNQQAFVAASNNFIPNISLSTVEPKVHIDQAISNAKMALPNGIVSSEPRLVVFPNTQFPSAEFVVNLSWVVELHDNSLPSRNIYIIDAIEGNILLSWNLLDKEGSETTSSENSHLSLVGQNQISVECDPPMFYGMKHCQDGETHILVINLEDPHVRVQAALSSRANIECNSVNHNSKDTASNCSAPYPFEKIESFLARYKSNGAVAAINTDYFALSGDHGAQGLAVRNGERLDGPNHGVTTDIAYTTPSLAFSPTKIPTIGIPGSQENIDNNLNGIYYNVVGGAPLIIQNGQPIGNNACTPTAYPYDTCSRASQSAAGLTADNDLVLITASTDATGIANYLVTNFSVQDALKFDGGGSARMAWLNASGQIQTFGGTTEDRAVAEALIIFSEPISSNRLTYDAENGTTLPGTLARSEGDPPTGDQDVDNAHDFAGTTYNYFFNTHNRDSYDNAGATIISTANYGVSYRNAFWDGSQMVYGDGFAVEDVVAHELTHAVTSHSANLEYKWQSGALNESFSDVFGVMVDRDDWLMGDDLPPEALGGQEAIRDLADPTRFGQPAHTNDWVATCSDNEGVHTNSGITNKAFYNIATTIGKNKAELIFYRTLTVYLSTNSSLEDARSGALQSAQDIYGVDSMEETAVKNGFNAVGLDGSFNPPGNDCSCAATTALSDKTTFADQMSALQIAATLYRLRDELSTTEVGHYYRKLYEQHSGRMSALLLTNAALRADAGRILQTLSPGLDSLIETQGGEKIVTQQIINDALAFLEAMAEADRTNGGGELADVIEQEIARINWHRLVGLTFTQAFQLLNLQPEEVQPHPLPFTQR